mmetsp:Transcript_24396/g.76970  ORF Transcript_24396/g.76970 Transcript_24396/m.76970 type:complete len:212 (+) Transcript_24396:935-1570(+)
MRAGVLSQRGDDTLKGEEPPVDVGGFHQANSLSVRVLLPLRAREVAQIDPAPILMHLPPPSGVYHLEELDRKHGVRAGGAVVEAVGRYAPPLVPFPHELPHLPHRPHSRLQRPLHVAARLRVRAYPQGGISTHVGGPAGGEEVDHALLVDLEVGALHHVLHLGLPRRRVLHRQAVANRRALKHVVDEAGDDAHVLRGWVCLVRPEHRVRLA